MRTFHCVSAVSSVQLSECKCNTGNLFFRIDYLRTSISIFRNFSLKSPLFVCLCLAVTLSLQLSCHPNTLPLPFSGLSPDVQTPPPVPDEGEAIGDHNTEDREGGLPEMRGDIPVLSTAAQEVQQRLASGVDHRYATPPRLTAEGQDLRGPMLKPPSAAHSRSYGVPVPSSAGQIPAIQVRGREGTEGVVEGRDAKERME